MVKTHSLKGYSKEERELCVLIGLVEYYVKTGKPVGSDTLRDAGFSDVSSATIRNYYTNLEEEGYLTQKHASGGRIPTEKAYRLYANENKAFKEIVEKERKIFQNLEETETREIAAFLQRSGEMLSEMTSLPVFLSSPRFDQDFVSTIKLAAVDSYRFLAILVTDFGVIQTELIHSENKITAFSLKRMEAYFHWRLTRYDKPEEMSLAEEEFAKSVYNELMMRYAVGYSTFLDDELYRTGFSKLFLYQELQETTLLARILALFENGYAMRLLLRECQKLNCLKFWIGEDLLPHAKISPDCAAIAIPYHINRRPVAAVGVLGPMRLQYGKLFALLKKFSEMVSHILTRSVYKFQIQYRQSEQGKSYWQKEQHRLLWQSRLTLLEDKSLERKKK